MNILTDKDPYIGYEINSVSRRIFNIFFIPLLNILPKNTKSLIQRSHKSVDEVVENATTHAALEVLYKKGHKKHSVNWIQKVLHRVWFDTNNSKAVRNRLRLVERELIRMMELELKSKKAISILSIASGSARAIVESIEKIDLQQLQKISVVFLDKNPHALDYSKKLIEEHQMQNDLRLSFSWINGTAGTYLESLQENQFDIIEMVGLLDYFDDERAVKIFTDIRRALVSGGSFITANINNNFERTFMTRVIGWSMIYRDAEALGLLLQKSGFNENEIKIYYEPLKIHEVALAIKK